MRIWSCVAAVVLTTIAAIQAVAAGDVLRVCLDEDLPPLSVHHRGKPASGFDVALAQAIAESSAGRCKSSGSKASWTRILAGAGNQCVALRWSLFAGRRLCPDHGLPGGAGPQNRETAGFRRRHGPDHRRRVPLGVLKPSHPYIYSALTVVLGPKAANHRITGIGDLAGLRIGIESGTLADALLMTFDKGRLIDDVTHLVPTRDDLLGTLERGDLDATLVDLRRLDAYRATHAGYQIDRFRIFLSDRRQSWLRRSRQRSGATWPRSTRLCPLCRPTERWPGLPKRRGSASCRRASR